MSRIIASAAIRGARRIYESAAEKWTAAVRAHGRDRAIAFPGTAYHLPVIYALLGARVRTLGDMEGVLEEAKDLLPDIPSGNLWLPYLGDALDAGVATLFCYEVIEALKFVDDASPYSGIWLGPTPDAVLREQGIKLVDGRMPGFAACIGALPSVEEAVSLARDLQERNILIFLAGRTGETSMAEQLAEAGVEMSWDTFLVPYGRDLSAAVHALGFAARSAMTFGGITPGDMAAARRILLYNRERVHAFVLALGEVDDEKYAAAAGAINFGFPVIADTVIPEILPTGICTYEHVVSNVSHDDMPARAIEVRGLKIQVQKIPIPVRYGPAFEGERVRREDLFVEFGGKHTTAFEHLRSREMGDVEDGRIEVVGPEIGDVSPGSSLPLALVVEVAGRKMQTDFESILERHIHTFLSEAMGVMHLGQRDVVWIRISKGAKEAGFRLEYFGTILRAKLLNDFPSIVDKVQVTIHTREEDVEALNPDALAAYSARDTRMGALTDESVEVFYSCQLCQSYAPNHVCIITPERLGLCGAYNWLDGKAAHEINPSGANQAVGKGRCLDPEKGKWEGINEFVYANSNRTLHSFSMYSMIDEPMTSCGCFECIMAVLPGTGGVMIVDREFQDMTPCGMPFSSLAESVGGGQQTPGFLGIGMRYIISKKFIGGDGGFPRIVWLTTNIKNRLREELAARAGEIGLPDFMDRVADETITTDLEGVLEHITEKGHPALEMGEMI